MPTAASDRHGSSLRLSPPPTLAELDERRELILRARARDELQWRQCEYDLGSFIPRVTPAYSTPEHFRELLDVLDESMRRPIIALVEGPPRHGKTDTILHHIARFLAFRPEEQVAYCSYGADMARRKSRKTREIAARAGVFSEPERQQQGPQFDPSRATGFWQTYHGGGLISGGRQGQFVGEGFGLIVIDDPTKNRTEAESAKVQEEVNKACFEGTLFTRRAPGASLIVTHQPWNDQDLIAYLREKFTREGVEFVLVRMPACRDPEYDDQGRLCGGRPLWAKRFPIPELRIIQAGTGHYNFESQYQLNRIPLGTTVFREPQRYDQPRTDGATLMVSCDPGIRKDGSKDPSAFLEGSCYLDADGLPCIDILWCEEVRQEIPETVDELEARSQRRGNAACIVEEVGAFASVSQVARRLDEERVKRGQSPAMLRIHSWVPMASKLVRAQPAAGAVRYGRIRVPRNAPWLPAFLRQLTRFTGRPGGEDNMVDALTQLYDWCYRFLVSQEVKAAIGDSRAMSGGGGGGY